ncbi:hypothetical protein C6P40_002681 [Pichia californica]|uniref:Calcium-transporting ATPase n=1 Tax=Pichia californica TaxID=460514 RepID=A0A9P6WQ63_9ASCO|nr:hypothetical protein C6P42_001678 [[Candida] californica]KAG0691290.1 hypothetical protein C6P40_002681 [[Candida] californica]
MSQFDSTDIESHGSHYKTSIADLQSLFDSKSIQQFINLFNNNIDNFKFDLNTNLINGLPLNDLDKSNRLIYYGKNKLPTKSRKSFLKLCINALNDKVLIILSISAIISLILGLYQLFFQPPDFDDHGNKLPKIQWIDGIAIILAILIVIIVSSINDYNKENQFIKLNNKKDDRNLIVLRSNEKLLISIYDLLVGDLLFIQTGDILPSDCILIDGNLESDESLITGESNTIKKCSIYSALSNFNNNLKKTNNHDPFLISGSKILSGQGKAIVVCVGPNSINGKMMLQLSQSNDINDEMTPLQNRLNLLADGISKYGLLSSIILFIILFIKFILNLYLNKINLPTTEILSKLINIIITSITIVVVAIPEGLPLAVTLSLAFATTRMIEDGNLVRVLKSCETMGGATNICSDKTGTLTINKMTVIQGLIGNDSYFNDNEENNISNSSVEVFKNCSNDLMNYLLNNIMLNSTAFENNQKDLNSFDINNDDLEINNNNSIKNSIWNILSFKKNKYNHLLPSDNNTINNNSSNDDFVGSKTECALLSLVKYKFSKFNNSIPNVHTYRENFESNIIKIIPFESSLKWSGIILHDLNNNKFTFYIKGAAEIILNNCKFITNLNGNLIDLNNENFIKINKFRESMSLNALRSISLAHYTFNDNEISNLLSNLNNISNNDLIKNYPLTLDLLVGIEDPLRPGVKFAIDQCHKAGVDVRMVTGDNILTAKAISKKCGILNNENFNNNNYFMEGPKFRSLSINELYKIVPNLHVLARSSPNDKKILVKILKDLGEVVAVTGDGTNDAPALKLADVGFSMGLSGTEVAREASDIVLMSDDFTSIVNAIKWGRTVSASIRKFVQFQLTVNFTAVILTFITAISNKQNSSVLTAVQLLWVNLIMDTLAALALATDKPDNDVLNSKPEGRNDKMISFNMWKMILGISNFQLIITLLLNFFGSYLFFGKSINSLKSFEKISLKAMIFNTFVWMQVFTLFVSRILNQPKELNENSSIMDRLSENNIGFFKHLTRNFWFIGIVFLISILQILIMFYGGVAFSIAPQSISMWIVSLTCGYLMIPFGILLRIIPDETLKKILPLNKIKIFLDWFEWFIFGCGCFRNNEHEDINEEEENNNSSEIYDSNNAGQYYNNYSNNNNNTHSNIIISESPSPILLGENVESHKMNHLSKVLSSTNNSNISLNNNNNNNKVKSSKSNTHSLEKLFDESSSRNINYTDNK